MVTKYGEGSLICCLNYLICSAYRRRLVALLVLEHQIERGVRGPRGGVGYRGCCLLNKAVVLKKIPYY